MDKRWFVAIVNARHEKAVVEKLLQLGIGAYAATQREMHQWANGRRRAVDRVVIPSMVFIHCSDQERLCIVQLPYILRFLVNRAADSGSLNKPVAVIPQEEMDRLQFILGHSDTPVNFVPTVYRIRDNVRVIRGPLRDLVGQITENSDGSHSLKVGMAMLGGVVIRINACDVERIPE